MKPSPNYQAMSKLADEFAQRLPTLHADVRRGFKRKVIKCMEKHSIECVKKSDFKAFLKVWRMILTDLERERNEKANKHAVGGDTGINTEPRQP